VGWLQAVLLGVVQGLTEFLPISSSGHLVIGQRLLGLEEPHLLFDVAVHVGTLVAVLIVFLDDLRSMLWSIVPGADGDPAARRLVWLVIVGSVPAGLAGLLLEDFFESLFASMMTVGVALLVTGGVLFATVRFPAGQRSVSEVGWRSALLVGVAQAMAIIPGISRSGATICAGLGVGMQRELAARFSFILSIPAILGALVLQLRDLPPLSPGETAPLLLGGVVAAATGYVALRLLISLVKRGRLHWFAYYCWCLGALTVAASLWW
jgi:undecaprenyl-diphosphatase